MSVWHEQEVARGEGPKRWQENPALTFPGLSVGRACRMSEFVAERAAALSGVGFWLKHWLAQVGHLRTHLESAIEDRPARRLWSCTKREWNLLQPQGRRETRCSSRPALARRRLRRRA